MAPEPQKAILHGIAENWNREYHPKGSEGGNKQNAKHLSTTTDTTLLEKTLIMPG
jgi:hypothetical protein